MAAGVEIIFILLVVGMFFVVVIRLELGRQRKMAENLAAMATRLGLEFKVEKKPFGLEKYSIEGQRQGKAVRIWSYTTGSGKSQRRWIAAGVQPQPGGKFTFRIEPQGFGTRIAELFGAKEIRVGDPRFDEAWFVRTNAPEVFGAALVPEIREKLMAARQAGAKGSTRLEDGWVMYSEEGSFAKAEAVARLESLLGLLFDLADVADLCRDAG